MKVSEAVLAALLLGMPVWLVARAWRSYLTLGVNSGGKLLQMQMGLILISVSAATWIVVFALMFLEDYSIGVRSLTQNLSPMTLGLVNILLCIGALGCSEIWRNSGPENTRLKRAIGVSSGVLMLVWLFLLANPH